MREVDVLEASRDFARVVAAAEAGETIVITRGGQPVARLAPSETAPRPTPADPEWQASYDRLMARLTRKDDLFRVGEITEDDLYGDDPK
jgi:prevent-host-death family protein